MGKSSAPKAPDYTPVAQADATAAANNLQLGKDQLQWSKDQFNSTWPYAQQYLQQQSAASAAETQNAQEAQSMYNSTYKPIETQLAQEATSYNSPDRANQNAGMAEADVASSFDASRTAALGNLESYGIDPSQTRYGALDLGTRISQAAATAGAGTQSRLNTEATGLALQGNEVNVGRGYGSNVAQDYNTATNSGSAGINAANSTTAMGASTMGTNTQYQGLASGNLSGQVGALNTGFQNQMAGAQFNAQQSAQMSSGIGSLIGGAAGMAMMAPQAGSLMSKI